MAEWNLDWFLDQLAERLRERMGSRARIYPSQVNIVLKKLHEAGIRVSQDELMEGLRKRDLLLEDGLSASSDVPNGGPIPLLFQGLFQVHGDNTPDVQTENSTENAEVQTDSETQGIVRDTDDGDPLQMYPEAMSVGGLLERVRMIAEYLSLKQRRSIQVYGVLRSLKNRAYGGFRYGSIQDENGKSTLDLKIPSGLADELREGDWVILEGVLAYRVWQGGLQPQVQVERVLFQGERARKESDLRLRFRHYIERPKRDVEGILFGKLMEGETVRIAFLATETAMRDIRYAMLGGERSGTGLFGLLGLEEVILEGMRFQEYRVNIEDPHDVVRALREAVSDHPDIVVIARGGGDTVGLLDHEVLLEAVGRSHVPVVVAAGHSTDHLVLDHVADLSFPTPTYLGNFLRGLQERVKYYRNAEIVRKTEQEVDRLRFLVKAEAALIVGLLILLLWLAVA